jgi:hypothetical protein
MMTSEALTASATGMTFSPLASAFFQELPSRKPTTTLAPLSLRLSEWAWPWLP